MESVKTVEVSHIAVVDVELGPDSTNEQDIGLNHESVPVKEIKPQQDSGKTKRVPETNNNEGLPIDKGWAWVVLAATAFSLLILWGIKRNFGIFFVEIQERFNSTASLTSVLVSAKKLINSFISLITMTIGMQFMSNRLTITIGALILTTSHIISAFATDIRMLFASIGFLEGIGKAFVYPPLAVSLLEYFHERRGLANGVAFSCASIGGLLFAPIIAELFDMFGYTGTLMIMAGMTLNLIVAGALMRPIKSFERQTLKTIVRKDTANNNETTENGSLSERKETSLNNSHKNKTNDVEKSFFDKLKASFDISVFKTLVFPVFLFMAAMLVSSSDLLIVFLAPLAKDNGLTTEQIGILLSFVSGFGLLSRILCAIFADREFMKLTMLLAVVATIAGITAHCARFFNSFPLLVVMAVLLGFTCEIYNSMYTVVLVQYLTLPKAKSCMGFTMLCHGVAVASTYPIVGWLRDNTGSYYTSYHLLGTMAFIGALCALALPHVHRRSKLK